MRVCDICKTKNAKFDTTVTVDDDGTTKTIEVCGLCYREFTHRENLAKHQAYEETIKVMAGEIPRKSHWWNMLSW